MTTRALHDLLDLEGKVARHRADPDEVATVVVFLASPLARYVTGAELIVDGAATLV